MILTTEPITIKLRMFEVKQKNINLNLEFSVVQNFYRSMLHDNWGQNFVIYSYGNRSVEVGDNDPIMKFWSAVTLWKFHRIPIMQKFKTLVALISDLNQVE